MKAAGSLLRRLITEHVKLLEERNQADIEVVLALRNALKHIDEAEEDVITAAGGESGEWPNVDDSTQDQLRGLTTTIRGAREQTKDMMQHKRKQLGV